MTGDQDDIFAFLQDPTSLGAATGAAVRRIDTHCAAVFLVGDRAFKVKKSVRFPYLDFSTLGKRKAACEAEIALNRPGAPSLYVGLRALGRDGAGKIGWAAPGPAGQEPVEWVVEMRRFADDALLTAVAARGALDDALCIRLADTIAAHHAQAPLTSDKPGIASIRRLIIGIRDALDHAGGAALDRREIAALIAAMSARAESLSGLINARAASGHVRRCHGDLHLANLCLIEGVPTLFDALEFDADLATIDVLYDLAFLVMDLEQRGLRAQASMILNRYLDRRDEQDGLALLPLFTAMRAAIRAYASAAAGKRDAALAYLEHARACLTTRPALLVAIGGLSGSGKSRLGRLLAGEIGGAGGARQLRSDVLRKTLAGVASAETRLEAAAYTAEASDRVYAAMRAQTGALLRAGVPVICDGVFARQAERDAIEAVAGAAGVPFVGLWLDAPPATLAARIEARTGDASDATTAVLEGQLGYDLGTITWPRLTTDRPAEVVAVEALALMPVESRREIAICDATYTRHSRESGSPDSDQR